MNILKESPCFQNDAVDLSPIKFRLMNKMGWPEDQTDLVIHEYRKFLFLLTTNPKDPLVPSPLVDEAWHAHILHTAMYMRHCNLINGGKYIHHKPTGPEPTGPKSGEGEHLNQYRATLEAYKGAFKEEPNFVVWPNVVDEMCSKGCSGKCAKDDTNTNADFTGMTTLVY